MTISGSLPPSSSTSALVAGLLGDVLADLDAAREGDDVGVRVGDHGIAHGARIAGHDRQHLRRQPRLVEDVGQQQRGQRRQLGRLGHHAVVGGDRRRDLVADHVERMIERRDGRDAAQHRRARGVDAARLAVRSDVAGIDLAVVADRHLAGQQVDVVGAADLVERVLQAQPGLRRDQVRDLLAPLGQDLGRAGEDLLAVVAGELRLVGGADLEGLRHLRRAGGRHRADDARRCRGCAPRCAPRHRPACRRCASSRAP